MHSNIIIGIVSYNPELIRMQKNLNTINNQAEEIVVVDNGSQNIDELTLLIKQYDNIYIIKNERNKGIAAALNQIGDYAEEKGKPFFLTLDQDSIAPSNLVEELFRVFDSNEIAIVCPATSSKQHLKTGVNDIAISITSGSLVSTAAWQDVKGFWEYLFIDEVDHEFCYQLQNKGYRIIRNSDVILDHVIGTPTMYKKYGHVFYPMNHNSFRRYYIARNSIILHHLYPDKKEPYPHRNIRLMRIMISILFCENEKKKKIIAMFKGIKDGIIWNMRNKTITSRRE